MTAYTLADCEALRRLAREFDDASSARKAEALALFARRAPQDDEALVAFHDALLFMLAYPQTEALHAQAARALDGVADRVEAIAEAADGEPLSDALHGSGLPGTRIAVTFNLQVARWLSRRFPRDAGLHAVRGEVAALRRILAQTLPPIEFETLASDPDDAQDYLAELGADRASDPLAWLLGQCDALAVPETLRRKLYDDLDAFVRIASTRDGLSRTTLRGLSRPLHLHVAPLARREDARRLLDDPLPEEIALDAADRDRLLTAARGLLALLGRQTDPISDCDGRGVYAYDLGRGVVVALFSAAPADRPPLDSHVGMMLFKNGLPVAYGGGWPYLGTCKIGINIFEPYRGGESHFLFLSVLRAYRWLFGVQRFIVERYQFGRNNPEGIASAAYWFYYRLGFRSMRGDLDALAGAEWEKLSTRKGYATPRDTLVAFTDAHMELRLPGCPEGYDYADPADLSRAVTAAIARDHDGDRRAFLAAMRARLGALFPDVETRAPRAFADLGPALMAIPDLEAWSAQEREDVTRLLEAREAPDERAWFRLLRAHPRLGDALARAGS